jgi:hypothetical protein
VLNFSKIKEISSMNLIKKLGVPNNLTIAYLQNIKDTVPKRRHTLKHDGEGTSKSSGNAGSNKTHFG